MNREPVPGLPDSDYTGRRKTPFWLIVTIIVLVAVAIGSSVFIYVRYTLASQPRVSVSPTAITSAYLMNMSTAQLYHYVMSKTPSLVDPLDGSQPGNWDDGPGCQFKQKAFYLTASPSLTTVICFLRNKFVHDFAFQIQVKLGPTIDLNEQQGCAILFRAHLIQQQSYAFNMSTISRIDSTTASEVTSNNASLDVYNSGGTVTELKSWSQGLPDHMDLPNALTVIAVHSQINLYINAQPQLRITDTTFQGGQIGLVGNSTFFSSGGTFNVAFRNMKLWIL